MVFDVFDAVTDQVDVTGSYWFLCVFTSHVCMFLYHSITAISGAMMIRHL